MIIKFFVNGKPKGTVQFGHGLDHPVFIGMGAELYEQVMLHNGTAGIVPSYHPELFRGITQSISGRSFTIPGLGTVTVRVYQ